MDEKELLNFLNIDELNAQAKVMQANKAAVAWGDTDLHNLLKRSTRPKDKYVFSLAQAMSMRQTETSELTNQLLKVARLSGGHLPVVLGSLLSLLLFVILDLHRKDMDESAKAADFSYPNAAKGVLGLIRSVLNQFEQDLL